MSEMIHWPPGEFTIEEAVSRNAAFPEAEVRKQLSAAIKAKAIVQTKKGNHRIKGRFQAVKLV